MADEKIAIIDFDGTLFYEDMALEEASKALFGFKESKEDIMKMSKNVQAEIYLLSISKYQDYYIGRNKIIGFVNSLKESNYKIYILAYRSTREKEYIKQLLDKNHIKYDEILTANDLSMSELRFKVSKINEIIKEQPEEVIYLDDNEEILKEVSRLFEKREIPAKIFLVKGDNIQEF